MKKYRFLGTGETVQAGDEQQLLDMSWVESKAIHHIVTLDDNQPLPRFRRPVPYEGKVAFLVTYSPMIRVVIDTTGLTDEQIDDKLAQVAKAEFCYNHAEHMNNFHDNIDWEQTREDTVVPFVEPEPKIPDDYRMLEIGDIIQSDDEYLFPEGWQLIPSIMVGDEFNADCDAQSVRRPVTEPQYRPFGIGDVIEDGDEVLISSGGWVKFSPHVFGETIESWFVMANTARKLVK